MSKFYFRHDFRSNKMKKATKILTIILIVVFVLSVFASCGLVGKDIGKYRQTTAMTVGDQKISVGKLLDTFNSYYNNYYYYISYGMLDMDGLLEMVLSALQQQYMQIDDYVTRHKSDADVVASNLKGKAVNAEFLTAEEFEYCIKYVRHISFTSFDTSVEAQISARREMKDAESEDTSRNFTEYDDFNGATTYAEYLYRKNFDSKEADEYFEKYYGADEQTSYGEVDIASYVYADEAAAAKRLEEFNDRIEDEEDYVDFDELVAAQKSVLNQYRDTIKTNYGITLDKFLSNQVDDMVSSCILAKWSYEVYGGKEDEIKGLLEQRFEIEKEAQITDFNIDNNFDSFITSLSSSKYLFDVPKSEEDDQNYTEKYVFVKNILVPFTTAQSNRLKVLADKFGDTDRPEYIAARNSEAAKILAEYFYSDKYDEDIESKYFSDEKWFKPNTDEDSDSKYEKIKGLFTYEGSNLAINPDGVLNSFFGDNGEVKPMDGKSKSETIVELMKRFNTDTAQHTATYDYVVYVGDDWEDYEHAWVEEFYTAVNQLRDSEGNFNGKEKYAMCVSSYGVHIIYVEGFVEDQLFKFDYSKSTDTSSAFYRWFASTFQSEVSKMTQERYEELQEQYLKDDKIHVTEEFAKFLDENGFTLDFDLFLEELKEKYA